MRISITSAGQPRDIASLKSMVELVNDSAAHSLWLGQSFLLDGLQSLAFLAGAGHSCPVGIGVALAPMRTPYDAALQARTFAANAGVPLAVGLGAADPDFTRAVTGTEWERPGQTLLNYAAAVAQSLRGPSARGWNDQLVAPPLPPIGAPVACEIGIGAVRPWLFTRALQHRDFVVTWLAPLDYVSELMGRSADTRARVVCMLPLVLKRVGRSSALLAREAVGHHVERPNYAEMLHLSGIPTDTVSEAARALMDRGVVLGGTADDVVLRLREMEAAGIDEVILDTTAVRALRSQEEARDDLGLVLDAWADRKAVQ